MHTPVVTSPVHLNSFYIKARHSSVMFGSQRIWLATLFNGARWDIISILHDIADEQVVLPRRESGEHPRLYALINCVVLSDIAPIVSSPLLSLSALD